MCACVRCVLVLNSLNPRVRCWEVMFSAAKRLSFLVIFDFVDRRSSRLAGRTKRKAGLPRSVVTCGIDVSSVASLASEIVHQSEYVCVCRICMNPKTQRRQVTFLTKRTTSGGRNIFVKCCLEISEKQAASLNWTLSRVSANCHSVYYSFFGNV